MPTGETGRYFGIRAEPDRAVQGSARIKGPKYTSRWSIWAFR
jgi:hypothetical protein